MGRARSVVVAAVALLVVHSASAQQPFGIIVGTVTDATGASLPGVIITVTNTETQGRVLAVTNTSGDYSLPT
jgi:hypothetical protein